jgi:hypothetical protein
MRTAGLAPLPKGFLDATGVPAWLPSYLDVTARETNFQTAGRATGRSARIDPRETQTLPS